ncbi:hypothetical protein [Sphingomonas endolithica]|uniref:hypothetical protein n=1 Tax=Sphingomonas endolithica TaxID=2972485 RepID=UPI0021B03FBC|nr:hypothetical protein [Sphingomonas sp. ZFBP2030]
MKNLTPTPRDQRPPLPVFTPVPRKYRYDGWTAERQRAFIEALADTGSVTAAAQRINMSTEGAYYLRRQPGAEGFRAAWESALDHGVQCLTDIAIDRALNGVPVPQFWRGEQVGEKRRINDRLLMFILEHHLPHLYGGALPAGTRHPETIAREAAENCPICRERREKQQETEANLAATGTTPLLERYAAKIRGERHLRLSGNIVAADFTLRQLTHIELLLDLRGTSMRQLIDTANRAQRGGITQAPLYASPVSQLLDERRREEWAKAGEPARPTLTFPETAPENSLRGGPNFTARDQARRAAEAMMAEAQKKWEAAATEESWAAWVAGGD